MRIFGWSQREARLYFPLFVLLISSIPSSAKTELVNCNGKWTNGPCEEGSAKTLPEKASSANDSPDRNDMRSLYTDLDLRNFRAKREFGIEISLEDARISCLSNKATLDECRKVTSAQNEKLDLLIAKAALSAPAAAEVTPQQQPSSKDQNQVVIINNNDDDDYWRRKWWRRKRDKYPTTYDLSLSKEVDEGTLANQAKKRREKEEKAERETPVSRGGKLSR